MLVVSNATMAQVTALVAANTTLSACAAALSAMFLSTLVDLRSYVISLMVWKLLFVTALNPLDYFSSPELVFTPMTLERP